MEPENLQVNINTLLQEGANIAADLTKRCMILSGQNSILAQQIRELQEANKALTDKLPKDNVTPIKKGDT